GGRLHPRARGSAPVESWFAGPPIPANSPAPPAVSGAVAPTAIASRVKSPARPRVSLCLIVRNEEANLPACLGSSADLVDEVVVVDTGPIARPTNLAPRLRARAFD